MDCSTPGFPVLHHLPELAQTHANRVGDAIQPSHPLSSPSPPAFNLSQNHGLFNESALHIRWPKYWHFSFSISPSSEYSGLISFRIDWCDLLAVQEMLKSLLQHHSSEASVLRPSAFFLCGWTWRLENHLSGKLVTCRTVCVGKDICFHSELKLHEPHLTFLNIIEFCIHEHKNPNLGSQPRENSS